jgi:hypothetical protein
VDACLWRQAGDQGRRFYTVLLCNALFRVLVEWAIVDWVRAYKDVDVIGFKKRELLL